MKTILLLTIVVFCIFGFGCSNAASPVAQNTNAVPAGTPERAQTAISHSSENQTPPPAGDANAKSKWKQSGDPIDTKAFDTAIAAAEVVFKKKPEDATAKKALAGAYYDRATALTGARQYASALGDYRRAVKYDPSNADAKGWIDKITMIYESMNRESPKEGEEPPPLPFTKGN